MAMARLCLRWLRTAASHDKLCTSGPTLLYLGIIFIKEVAFHLLYQIY
jgi:hypothetical protein